VLSMTRWSSRLSFQKRKVDTKGAIWQIPCWSHPGVLWVTSSLAVHTGRRSPGPAFELRRRDVAHTEPRGPHLASFGHSLLIVSLNILLSSTPHPPAHSFPFSWLACGCPQQCLFTAPLPESPNKQANWSPQMPPFVETLLQPCLQRRSGKKCRPHSPPWRLISIHWHG
jgi:hypothetical protein